MKRMPSRILKHGQAGSYVGLLLSMMLLAGQVQYAYTAYYCTIKHAPVKEPLIGKSLPIGKINHKICDECQGVEIIYHTVSVSKQNCLRVERHKKNVIGSFTDTEACQSHSGFAIFGFLGNHAGQLIMREAEAILPLCGDAHLPGNIPIPSPPLRI